MEFFQTLGDRLRSPFFGNFLISWLAFNWKIVYTTFFVSESSLREKNKLEAVYSIIDGYGCLKIGYILLFPAIYTFLVVKYYPGIRAWADKIRLGAEYDVQKFDEGKKNEVETLKNSHVKLNNAYNKLISNTRNELIYNIVNYRISWDQIFVGIWKIEIFDRLGNTHIEHEECSMRKDKFIDKSGEIIALGQFNFQNSQPSIHNFNPIVHINIKGKESKNYNVYIESRGLINFNDGQGRYDISLRLVEIK